MWNADACDRRYNSPMDDADKREKGAANARAVGWAALVGAVCGALWGAFLAYLLIGDAYLFVADVILDVAIWALMFVPIGATLGMDAAVGFRFITGKL
jgi:hypothetical protein